MLLVVVVLFRYGLKDLFRSRDGGEGDGEGEEEEEEGLVPVVVDDFCLGGVLVLVLVLVVVVVEVEVDMVGGSGKDRARGRQGTQTNRRAFAM